MSTLAELRNTRLEKLRKLEQLGVDAFPANANKNVKNIEVINNFDKLENTKVTAAGRITAIRAYKDLAFVVIKDGTSTLQLYIKRASVQTPNRKNSELAFEDINLLDISDYIEAYGTVTKTKTGEISVEVETLRMLSKAIRPVPDKWEGFKDIEERYRKRYVDLLINDEAKKLIDTRWKITEETRKFLWKNEFKEVETPILQPLYGGTNARPFSTHFNALNCDFYLRVAPELYLKRLIVGGYERVFEIARNFRNEGIDHSHFPEFTMLEWYEAYADYHRVMDLAEDLIKHLVKEITGGTIITVKGQKIDVGKKWERIAVEDILKKELGIEWDKVTNEEAKELAKKYKLNIRGTWDKNKLLFNLYDSEITPKLSEPTWVIDYPISVSPLSHAHRSKPGRAERFEGYIGGVEIFDGWSEIVSGIEQRNRFENEQRNMKDGDAEAMPLDEDFIEALEHGCPPLGGIGFGIDRLTMFLTDTWAIKDVVAFPTLKPRGSTQNEETQKTVQTEKPTEVKPVEKTEVKQKTTQGTEILNLEAAQNLLTEHMQNQNLRRHCYAVGKSLAAYYDYYKSQNRETGELNKEQWEITGILHDADWEVTTNTPDKHTVMLLEWLEKYNTPEEMLNVFKSHNNKITKMREPQTLLEWTLECCDELTGFIVAITLMMPEKKLSEVTVERIFKKFKQKEFAKPVDRGQILQCQEKLGIAPETFVEITLKAMQQSAELLGF